MHTTQNAKEYNANDCNRNEYGKYNIPGACIDVIFSLELEKDKQIAHQHTERKKNWYIHKCEIDADEKMKVDEKMSL